MDLDLHFEKVYKWVARCPKERDSFISCLWRVGRDSFIHVYVRSVDRSLYMFIAGW